MSSFSELFASSDQPNSLGARFRTKRLQDFEELFFTIFSATQPIKILDVGGTDYFWRDSKVLQLPNVELILLNLHLEKSDHPAIRAVQGDATNMSEFAPHSFDLVFSNSVIEHLYNFAQQKKMADEILRVGKHYFIQTPNRHFPVEAHYALPLAQHMPRSWVYFLLTKTRLSRLEKWTPESATQYLDEIRLLSEREMLRLFPEAQIYREKFLGLTKSFAAHNLHF
ncbi:class I SAM-dependent methyltransferase [Algoriphagus namhaensis]